eukprot:scaffold83034_cov63-Phaeocystis_antarctica.AAC.4
MWAWWWAWMWAWVGAWMWAWWAGELTAPSSTYGCCCWGMRGMTKLMRPGMTKTATPPKKSIRPSETAIGAMSATGVGLPSACSSESRSSAMTSSSTAAAMMSWPVGVLSSLACLSTLSAMPIEVGASVQPTASAA